MLSVLGFLNIVLLLPVVSPAAESPRILLVGDSVSASYGAHTQRILQGSTVVHAPPSVCGSTSRALINLSTCLGSEKWDLIHFNWGLDDIGAGPEGAKLPVPIAQYEKNLRTLVEKLQATGATLIWASTTPIPSKSTAVPIPKNSDVIAYNTVAKRLMEENQIIIDDLYSFLSPRIGSLMLPGSTSPTAEGSRQLGDRVATSILGAQAAIAWKKLQQEVFVPQVDNPTLPRVLLIGDSISLYYTGATRRYLSNKANVHRAPFGGNTALGVQKLTEWLGAEKWDVIHFNWGLHDIALRDQSGAHAVPIEQYGNNLRRLVEDLKKTGAKLIWATTTPVPPEVRVGPPRRNEDVIVYNKVARIIMEENRIRIDDLYSLASPRLIQLQKIYDVHFTNEGSEILAGQVARSILSALEQ